MLVTALVRVLVLVLVLVRVRVRVRVRVVVVVVNSHCERSLRQSLRTTLDSTLAADAGESNSPVEKDSHHQEATASGTATVPTEDCPNRQGPTAAPGRDPEEPGLRRPRGAIKKSCTVTPCLAIQPGLVVTPLRSSTQVLVAQCYCSRSLGPFLSLILVPPA